jgi:hypothetical protein
MDTAAKKATEKRLKTRDTLWPDVGPIVFDTSDKAIRGYARIPRVVPMVARLINAVGGSENAGALYQTLWAQDWGQGIVEVKSFRTLLYEAGYAGKGSRVERTWHERIDILKKLGFIKTARKGLDECAYILLIDPHIAVLKLINNKVLSTTDGKVFEEWFKTFELVCEQWGISLSDYHSKVVAMDATAGATA